MVEDVLDRARDWVKNGCGLSYTAFVFTEGRQEINNSACFAGLNRDLQKGLNTYKEPPIYLVTDCLLQIKNQTEAWEYTPLTHKQYRIILTYLNWLANESTWAPCFMTKDAKDIFRNGAVFHTNFPTAYVIQAAIGIRYITEYFFIIKNWWEFREYMEANLALHLSAYFIQDNSGTYIIKHPPIGHNMYEYKAMAIEDIKDMLSCVWKENEPYLRQDGSFSPLVRIWQGHNRTNNFLNLAPFIPSTEIKVFNRVQNKQGIPKERLGEILHAILDGNNLSEYKVKHDK